jgi:hypothetical protein
VNRQTPLLVALALLAGPAQAQTVEASSSTFLNMRAQTRYRGGTDRDVVTVAPVYEILTITARDIPTGATDDLRIVLSTWGVWNGGGRRWDAGTDSRLTGDVTVGYLQAKFLHRHLTLRLGRAMVATGPARMMQIDGGEMVVTVPLSRFQVSVSGYGGVPTSQRFQGRSGLVSWNPVAGTSAYGGRAALGVTMGGLPGRGIEVGATANLVQDHSDTVRKEAGVDLRFQPFAGTDLALTGFGTYSLFDERFAEASAALTVSPMPRLHLSADWRFVEPSLLLSRNSILSVFTASTWSEYGGGFRYDIGRSVHAGVDGHVRAEPGKDGGGTHLGSDVAGRFDWDTGTRAAGLELSHVNTYDNGYYGARAYGRRDFGKVVLTGDVLGQLFREDLNGQRAAVTGTLAAAYRLPHDFSAVVAGSAGMTPYMQQTLSITAKLAYNQTYRTVEVR